MVDQSGREETSAMGSRLGYLGLVPFIAGAILALLSEELGNRVLGGFLIYSVAILSFMGGVHWGLALVAGEMQRMRLAISIVPVLVAWLGVWLLPPVYAVALMGAAFIGQWRLDRPILAALDVPRWYVQIRPRLAYTVAGCHLLVLFRLLG